MAVQDTRKRNTEKNSGRHDECKDDRAKVLDGVKDEQLSNGGANRKQEKMQMDFVVFLDELECGVQFLRVNQCDKRQDCRKGRSREHELHHGEIAVTLEHAALELAGETIEKEKEEEQHDSRKSRVGFFSPRVVSEAEVFRRRHEHGDADSNHQSHKVVVLRIYVDRNTTR